MPKFLETTLLLLDEACGKRAQASNDSSGTTAVLAAISHQRLTVANIGDSQACLLMACKLQGGLLYVFESAKGK